MHNFPVPFKVMYISLRYINSLKNNSAVIRFGYFRLFGVKQKFSFTLAFVFSSHWMYFSEINTKKKKIIAIKIYLKIPSLFPSILGRSMVFAKLIHIYMGVGVLLTCHAKKL